MKPLPTNCRKILRQSRKRWMSRHRFCIRPVPLNWYAISASPLTMQGNRNTSRVKYRPDGMSHYRKFSERAARGYRFSVILHKKTV